MPKIKTLSCTECGQLHCYRHNKKYPDFCLSETTDPDEVEATAVIYRGDSLDAKYAKAAADVAHRDAHLLGGQAEQLGQRLLHARRVLRGRLQGQAAAARLDAGP